MIPAPISVSVIVCDFAVELKAAKANNKSAKNVKGRGLRLGAEVVRIKTANNKIMKTSLVTSRVKFEDAMVSTLLRDVFEQAHMVH